MMVLFRRAPMLPTRRQLPGLPIAWFSMILSLRPPKSRFTPTTTTTTTTTTATSNTTSIITITFIIIIIIIIIIIFMAMKE